MVTGYPQESVIVKQALLLFEQMSEFILQEVFPFAFLLRLLYLKVLLKNKYHYKQLMEDTLILVVGLIVFKDFINLVVDIPVYAKKMMEGLPAMELDYSVMKEDKTWWDISFFGFTLWDIKMSFFEFQQQLMIFLYWFMYWIHSLFISCMIALGSLIIFLGSILRIHWLLKLFISVILVSCMWPFIWYMFDYVMVLIMNAHGSTISFQMISIMTGTAALFKMFMPFFLLNHSMNGRIGSTMAGVYGLATGKTAMTLGSLAKSGVEGGGSQSSSVLGMTDPREANFQNIVRSSTESLSADQISVSRVSRAVLSDLNKAQVRDPEERSFIEATGVDSVIGRNKTYSSLRIKKAGTTKTIVAKNLKDKVSGNNQVGVFEEKWNNLSQKIESTQTAVAVRDNLSKRVKFVDKQNLTETLSHTTGTRPKYSVINPRIDKPTTREVNSALVRYKKDWSVIS